MSTMTIGANPAVLRRIECYLDAAPRAAVHAETVGPFSIFVQAAAWPYYARPAVDANRPATVDDVLAVCARQRELGLPQAFEWVAETTPALGDLVKQAGLRVQSLPLMVCEALQTVDPPTGYGVRLISADDRALRAAIAVARVGFGVAGTQLGAAGILQRDAVAGQLADEQVRFTRQRLRQGLSITAIAESAQGPESVGTHQPIADLSEVVGVATLPAMRRRGLAAAVTSALVADALEHGVDIVFLSAGDEDIARVYGGLGFVTVGTFCVAEPANGSGH